MDDNNKGLNILVCGSQKFNDESFVFGMLDSFYLQSKGKVNKVFTSQFSGACEFARNWVEQMNERLSIIAKENNLGNPPVIQSGDCTFDMLLLERNGSLYEQLDIPDFLLQNDPFYLKGKELISQNHINLVMAFPNPQGILGTATYNIKRFAGLAGIGDRILDCSEALKQLIEVRNTEIIVPSMQQPKTEKTGFVNKHPARKF